MKSATISLLAVPAIAASIPLGLQGQSSTIIDLTNVAWTLSSHNVSVPGKVPSQAHLDLLAAGVIDEPTYSDNDIQQEWVIRENFTYTSEELSNLDKSSSLSTYLVFDGLDTFANISFCGKSVASVDNQFRQWEFEISNLLAGCATNPTVEVAFTAAPEVALDRFQEAYGTEGTSCISCYAIRFKIIGRQFMRKQQNDFGWDWGPALSPQGIWQPARIIQVPKQNDQISLQNVFVDVYKQGQINNLPPNQAAPWILNVSVDYLGSLKDDAILTADLVSSSGEIFEKLAFEDFQHKSGTLTASAVVQNEPELWWPVGQGKQVLYNLTVNVVSGNSVPLASAQKRFGFRTIVLNQTPVSATQLARGIGPGGNWQFEINGQEFYAKGSNLIPPDPFWPRVNETSIRTLFSAAIAGNQNMLRVWSSNIYLPDYVYDIADEIGLLLWSELQFSDAFYPNDTSSLQNYVQEVSYQVRRINNHPSLALWCGGNELEIALLLVKIGAPNNIDASIANYESIFLDTLLHAVFDNTRSITYIASSTNNGYKSFEYNRSRPIEPRYDIPEDGGYYGDSDYYNYDATKAFDLSTYPVSRFTNEFGFISHSSYQTYSGSLPPDQLSFNSSVIEHRNRHYALNITDLAIQSPYVSTSQNPNRSLEGIGHMSQGATLFYPSPNNTDSATIFDLQIYATQLFQAEFVRSQIDFYRRGSGLPQRNMGSLYWQLNEIWAAPTWASLEIGGRWKLLHHMASDAYLPVVITAAKGADSLAISVASDLWEDVSGYAEMAWYDWSGNQLDTDSTWTFDNKSVNVGAINSTQIWNVSLSDLPEQLQTAVAILRTNVSTSEGVRYYAERYYVPQILSNQDSIQAFADPKLEVSYDADEETFTVTSQAVAAFVWLDHPLEVKGYFTQNAFWMLPGTWTLKFVAYGDASTFPEGWQNQVTVKSVYDLVPR